MKYKKQSNHYVDNKSFYDCIVVYKQKIAQAQKDNKPKPRIPEFAGLCIMQIAENLATKHNFVNYPFKQDMIGDAIENSIKYFDNFNEEKYKNPFSYFTKIIYWAFVRRIQQEKAYLYTKHKLFEKSIVLQDILDQQDSDERNFDISSEDMNSDKMQDFINAFESKLKKKDTEKKPPKGLEKFVEA